LLEGKEQFGVAQEGGISYTMYSTTEGDRGCSAGYLGFSHLVSYILREVDFKLLLLLSLDFFDDFLLFVGAVLAEETVFVKVGVAGN